MGIFKFDSNATYRLIDIDLIERSSNKSFYNLRCVFSSVQDGKNILSYLRTNIQFSKNLLTDTLWTSSGLPQLSPSLVTIDIPEIILASKPMHKMAEEYVHDRHIIKALRFNGKGNPMVETTFAPRICVYELKDPISVDGRLIYFICFSSYEIARYFLFGYDRYNEQLLVSDFSTDSENKIFNPGESKVFEVDGIKNYYVQLRKTTPNVCSQEAGDLAFIPKFKEEVDKLVGTLRTGNIKTFYSLELPIERFDKFSVLGEYITSLSGFDGVWAKIIVNVEGYTPAYIFGRDNDGRTTEKKNPNLPKSFPGTTPKKQKDKKNVPPVDPDNSVSGDPDLEPISIENYLKGIELPIRGEQNRRVEKLDQDYQADNKNPSDPVNSTLAAGLSGNGEKGTNVQGISNSPEESNGDSIDFWVEFPQIIKRVSEKASNLDIKTAYLATLENKIVFQDSVVRANFKMLKNIKSPHFEFYLVRFMIYGTRCYYLIEVNYNIYAKRTMLFWKNDKVDFTKEELVQILQVCYEHSLNATIISEEISQNKKSQSQFETCTFRHQFEGKRTKQFSPSEAIDNHAKKIADRLEIFEY